MHRVYEAAGGSEGLLRLAGAWQARVMAGAVVSHAFSRGFRPRHGRRLAAYWAEALVGPAAYSGGCGDQASVVRIHGGSGPHQEVGRRAIGCSGQAMHDAGLDAAGPLRQVLRDCFAWAATTEMARCRRCAEEVPAGLSMPRWSWDGLRR